MKQLALTILAGFLVAFSPHASASPMYSGDSQNSLPDYDSPLGPNANIIFSLTPPDSTDHQEQGNNNPTDFSFTQGDGNQGSNNNWGNNNWGNVQRDGNNNDGNPGNCYPNPKYTPTPEPASASLLLMGLFGAGLCLARKRQAQQ